MVKRGDFDLVLVKKYVQKRTVLAARITKKNYNELVEYYDKDGCLSIGGEGVVDTSLFGDWLVIDKEGNQIVPNSIFKEEYKPGRETGMKKPK